MCLRIAFIVLFLTTLCGIMLKSVLSESVFCTESVMLSARFIPESVFYTLSVVRSPCFILTGHHTTLEKRLFSQRENMAILLTNSAALARIVLAQTVRAEIPKISQLVDGGTPALWLVDNESGFSNLELTATGSILVLSASGEYKI